MRQRVDGEWCSDPTQASPFAPQSTEPGCAFHLSGAERGLVDVFCPSGEGRIVLEGDDTRFLEVEGLSAERQAQLLTAVARERLAGLRRARDFDTADRDERQD
jgi:hypothetical protein